MSSMSSMSLGMPVKRTSLLPGIRPGTHRATTSGPRPCSRTHRHFGSAPFER